MTAKANLLSESTSPYLRQHASNPVDWQPWSEQALAQARQENKPILLSIGYSACHWCHVMAHESFEDPATAQLMNALFVNIKVDREERPDLDKIYQSAHQLLAGRSGGWPLTMFLSPVDQTPFFGGTYFPPTARHGLPAFTDLIQKIAHFFQQNQAQIKQQSHSLLAALAAMIPSKTASICFDAEPLQGARQQLEQSFDPHLGGFGQAPKFPHPSNIERLLRHWAASRATGAADTRALEMATLSLFKMAEGGINDHLGGGFCRYSVDERWMIPHFEKMLYDNGPLLARYADAWHITGQTVFQNAALGIANWVLREMQSEAGGYYSSLDADTEGEEGRFYYWDKEQIQGLLSEQEWPIFARRYGLDHPPNFEGHWHLHGATSVETLSQTTEQSPEQLQALLVSAQNKLFQVRAQRIPPDRDDKILTSWNALMITGMVRAGRHLGQARYIASATAALGYIQQHLWQEGRLLATTRAGQTQLPAYLDDYAYLIEAILELLQSQWQSAWLRFATTLADILLSHFEDPEQGGFFFTAHDHEPLIQRPKSFSDEAIPSGNGVAAKNLMLLGHLLGESRYIEAAERTLRLAWSALLEMPYAHTSLLDALEIILQAPEFIIIRGPQAALTPWLAQCQQDYRPNRLSFAIPSDAQDLPQALALRTPGPAVRAYRCTGSQCSPPIDSLAELTEALAS